MDSGCACYKKIQCIFCVYLPSVLSVWYPKIFMDTWLYIRVYNVDGIDTLYIGAQGQMIKVCV